MKPPPFPQQHKPEIAASTTCLHCKQMFIGPRTVLKAGEQPHQRFFKYLAELNGHIVEKHTAHFELASTLGAELQGMLILQNFISRDPEVLDQMNYYRWKVHQATLKVQIDDAAIDRKVKECIAKVFGEHPPDQSAADAAKVFTEAMRELRDLLGEPGAYKIEALPSDPMVKTP